MLTTCQKIFTYFWCHCGLFAIIDLISYKYELTDWIYFHALPRIPEPKISADSELVTSQSVETGYVKLITVLNDSICRQRASHCIGSTHNFSLSIQCLILLKRITLKTNSANYFCVKILRAGTVGRYFAENIQHFNETYFDDRSYLDSNCPRFPS